MASDREQRVARSEAMRKEREKADRKQRNLITVAIVVIVVALIGVAGWAISSAGDDDSSPLVTPAHTNDSFGVELTAADAGGTAGEDPVSVVLYEDFQCPICRTFEEQNGAYLDDLVKQGEITVEYRIFAFLDEQSSTNYSTRSANAAMAVLDSSDVATFRKFHGLLFANQPPEGGEGLDDSTLIDLAEQAGATGIDQDVKDQTFAPWVRKALAAGKADDIGGTPTVLVDGTSVNATRADVAAAIAAAK